MQSNTNNNKLHDVKVPTLFCFRLCSISVSLSSAYAPIAVGNIPFTIAAVHTAAIALYNSYHGDYIQVEKPSAMVSLVAYYMVYH